jgi:hypothetical protein
MRLIIYGQLQTFTPLKDFRAAHGLPPNFGVSLFEPKSYDGLGRIDSAGAELNSVRQAIVSLVKSIGQPEDLSIWLKTSHVLRDFFQRQLESVNPQVGLRPPEVEFAVAGFGDVIEAVIWALLRARATKSAAPPFAAIYAEWLNNTVRASQTIHEYAQGGERWGVQMVNNAYGRVGMYIRADDAVYFVADSTLACPAEGFMQSLLAEVAAYILQTQE